MKTTCEPTHRILVLTGVNAQQSAPVPFCSNAATINYEAPIVIAAREQPRKRAPRSTTLGSGKFWKRRESFGDQMERLFVVSPDRSLRGAVDGRVVERASL